MIVDAIEREIMIKRYQVTRTQIFIFLHRLLSVSSDFIYTYIYIHMYLYFTPNIIEESLSLIIFYFIDFTQKMELFVIHDQTLSIYY